MAPKHLISKAPLEGHHPSPARPLSAGAPLHLDQVKEQDHGEKIQKKLKEKDMTSISSWWLNQPHLKNMLIKMGSSSPNRGENKKTCATSTQI